MPRAPVARASCPSQWRRPRERESIRCSRSAPSFRFSSARRTSSPTRSARCRAPCRSVSPNTSTSGPSAACARGRTAGGTMPVTVGDEIAPLIGARAGRSRDAAERDDRADVGAVRARLRAAARHDRDDRRSISRPCATCTTSWRRDSALASWSCRATTVVSIDAQRVLAAIDERTRSWPCRTCSFARRTSWTPRRSAARAQRGRRARVARRLPLGGRDSRGREGARRRFPQRRRVEVAVRRTGRRVPLRVA